MKKIKQFLSILFFTAFVPLTTFAQQTTGLGGVLVRINELLSDALPVLIGIGVIYFIWGVVQYFIADSEEAKNTGRDRIIYGIIGLAVIVSVWGLVAILNQTLGLSGSSGLVGQNAPNTSNLVTQATGSNACSPGSKLQGLMDFITCVIGKSVIPFIFAIAIVMFIWGAVNFFILNGGEEEKRTQGKQFMLWGIIALAVMISVWGLVAIFADTFNLPRGTLPSVKP